MADVFEGKYGIGGVYEYMPGQWGKYKGNGLFQPIEDPDKGNKIAELKKQLGDLYFRLKNGDTSVIPEIKRLSNLGVGGVYYGFSDTNTGNSDQYDSLVESWGLAAPEGYKTKTQQAQEHARDAKYYAQQYIAAYNLAQQNKTDINAIGKDALAKMIAELKAETALIGGGYNFYNDESTHMIAEALANGKLTANSYETKTTPKPLASASTNSTSGTSTSTTNTGTTSATSNASTMSSEDLTTEWNNKINTAMHSGVSFIVINDMYKQMKNEVEAAKIREKVTADAATAAEEQASTNKTMDFIAAYLNSLGLGDGEAATSSNTNTTSNSSTSRGAAAPVTQAGQKAATTTTIPSQATGPAKAPTYVMPSVNKNTAGTSATTGLSGNQKQIRSNAMAPAATDTAVQMQQSSISKPATQVTNPGYELRKRALRGQSGIRW